MKNNEVLVNTLLRHDERVLKIVNIVMAIALIGDVALQFVSIIAKLTPAIAYETVFLILVCVFTVCQVFTLELIRHRNKEIIRKTPYLKTLTKIVRISQYILNGVLILMAVQIILFSAYQTILLTMVSTATYASTMLIMGALSLLFFQWYMRNKTFSIFVYGSASCSVVVSLFLLAALTDYVLPGIPAERNPDSQANMFVFESSAIAGSIQFLAASFSAVSFLLFWVSTLILLSHFEKKIGKSKFWPIMSLPIISFVIQYAVVSPILASLAGSPDVDLIYVTIFGNVAPAVTGGLLYGVPFWLMSRTFKDGSNVMLKKYLVIAAWGAVFLQLTTSGSAYTAPYPPFGFVTLLFTPVACYMVLFGIYSSAISISEDSKLRQSIRKYAVEESAKLVGDIASANIKQALEKKALEVARKAGDSLREQSGVHPSISDEELEDYLNDVLSEIKDRRED
jgi:hypothetical protein